jgi:hypothetical protein
LIPSLEQSERETLARQVVDFLLAQKNGYVPAYMEVFQEGDREAVLKHLKGCHKHFRAQITRIKRNRTIIQAKDEVSPLIAFHLSACCCKKNPTDTFFPLNFVM